MDWIHQSHRLHISLLLIAMIQVNPLKVIDTFVNPPKMIDIL